ncbi:hypothetical protein ABZ863_24225 [Saccharomonospora sp. NPDC046836]|uniref:hypothetical protein n=1 Tax=Saccharomonospora sp. NPDC046836 TaxID=3156921 RepID=UPI0033DD6E6C
MTAQRLGTPTRVQPAKVAFASYAAIAGFLAELFPARSRHTGASVAYQVGGMVTSGPAPFVVGALFAAAGGSRVLACYIVAACVVTFAGLLAAGRDMGSVQ